MSFLVKTPKLSMPAAAQQQMASYQEAEPVPFGYGRGLLPAHWLSDAFNWREAPAGKNEAAYQYTSIAFGLGAGPIDRVGIMKQDGKLGWDFGYTFAPGEDYHDFVFNASMAGGYSWWVRIYRGSETQMPDAALIAGTGQNHPAYRGLAYAVMHNINLGKGNTTIPSFAIECGRNAPAIGSDHGAGSAYGVNPFAAIYGLMLEDRGGDFDASLVDAGHWGALADALWTTGVHGRTGEQVLMHPWFRQGTSLADAMSQILAYCDGYVYAEDGKLRVGWFPGGVPSGSMPELEEDDLEVKPSGGGFPDWNQSATSIAVVFTDAVGRDYEDGFALYHAPANRETGIAAAPQRKDRPFVHLADQAQKIAVEMSAGTIEDTGVNLSVLKSRAVRLDSTPLIPSDVFRWNYQPHSLALVCRVVSRRIRAGAASDLLEVIRERGAFPTPYAPAVDSRVPYVPVLPVDVANYRLWFLPPGFGGGRQITCLVDRPAPQNIATKLHLSSTGAAPWEEILEVRSFGAKSTVDAGGVTIGAATARVTSTSLDWARMQAQSSLAQKDDTLLLLIDDELLSVGSISVVSAGVYDLTVLRGRLGSTAAAHAGAVEAWLFYYDEIQPTTHSEFYEVRLAGVYDSGTATKHFKLQAVSADGVNDPAPNDPGISWQLPDLSEADSAGTRTFRSATAPVGDLRVGDLWFQTSGGDVIGTYRWNGSTWVDVSDSRIGDNDAAVRALIAEVNADVAQMVLSAADHAAALLQEVTQRQAAVAAEAAARAAADTDEATARAAAIAAEAAARTSGLAAEAASRGADIAAEAAARAADILAEATTRAAEISSEASTRASADAAETSARTSADSTLQTNINTVAADITSEASTRATADSAETSARTSADSVLQGNINTVAASLTSEASTRATADAAETTARTAAVAFLQGQLDTAVAAIETEQTTRATAVEALASDIARLIAIFNDNAAAIHREFSVRTTALAAETTARESAVSSLTTSIGTVAAALTAEETTRASADAAETSARTTADSTLQGNINTVAASLTSEATTRAAADSAETTARTSADSVLQGNIDTVAAGLSTEQTTRATAVEALASDIARLIAIFNDNAAAIHREFSVRTTALAAETTARESAVSSLTTSIGTVAAALTAEETTRATADSAETSARTAADSTLQTNINTVSASLTSEASTRAAADAAETTAREAAISTLTSDIGTVSAALASESSTRASADSAETSARTAADSTLQTNINTVSASLTSEASTRASADSAMSSSITSLNTSVGTLNSTVNILAASYISGGVAVAMAGWVLDVNGYATSLKLITASGPVTVSHLVLDAADMMTSNYAESGGFPTAGWKAGFDGIIRAKAARLRDCDITGTLRAGSVIEADVTGAGGLKGSATDAIDDITSTSWVDTSCSVTITADGNPRMITLSGNVEGDPTLTRMINLRLMRGATQIGDEWSVMLGPGDFEYLNLPFSDAPAAGSVTYTVQAHKSGGSGGVLSTVLSLFIL